MNKIFFWIFIFWTFVVVFTRLGTAPVYIENEAREGIYIRAMLQTGNWILPNVPDHVECGEIVPDKPPLFHWLGASAVKVFEQFYRGEQSRATAHGGSGLGLTMVKRIIELHNGSVLFNSKLDDLTVVEVKLPRV